MNERLTELEMKFMQQQNTLEELDAVLCHQAAVIDRLQREVETLKELCRSFVPSINRTAAEEEPPPHY